MPRWILGNSGAIAWWGVWAGKGRGGVPQGLRGCCSGLFAELVRVLQPFAEVSHRHAAVRV